jgi:hypothetical protein
MPFAASGATASDPPTELTIDADFSPSCPVFIARDAAGAYYEFLTYKGRISVGEHFTAALPVSRTYSFDAYPEIWLSRSGSGALAFLELFWLDRWQRDVEVQNLQSCGKNALPCKLLYDNAVRGLDFLQASKSGASNNSRWRSYVQARNAAQLQVSQDFMKRDPLCDRITDKTTTAFEISAEVEHIGREDRSDGSIDAAWSSIDIALMDAFDHHEEDSRVRFCSLAARVVEYAKGAHIALTNNDSAILKPALDGGCGITLP